MRARRVLVIVSVLVGVVGVLPVAAAPRSTISVLDQSVTSDFPTALTFSLRVSSDAGDIVGATVRFQVGWENASRMATPAPFSAGSEVELTAVWDTAGETVPPFVSVVYYWEVLDSTGETLTTEPVEVEYEDYSQAWQRLEDENVIVYWHDQPQSFGQQLFIAAQESYEHVSEVTGFDTERPIRVVVYNRQVDFCSFYAPNSCESWVGGQTFEGITVQWGTNPEWFYYDVVPHELAHVFYGEIFRRTWVDVPTWFNEGIAVYNERTDHVADMNRVLAEAERGELRSLPVMTRGGGVAEGDAGTWYSIAYSIVAYVSETYGEEALGELILTLADNVAFEDALEQTTGMNMADLEMGWREWLGYPIDSVPTPIVLAPLEITPFGLPSAQGGGSATSTPAPEDTAPEPTAVPETEEPPEPTPALTEVPPDAPSGIPCLGLIGLALPVGGLFSVVVAHRRRRWQEYLGE